MSDPFRLDGRVAVITGGGSGLGLAIARCYVDAGAKVLIVGQTASKLDIAIEKLGENARAHRADVTASDSADGIINAACEAFGQLDIVVNNAGTHLKKPFEETSSNEFRDVLDVHVTAAFDLTRAALPFLRVRGGSVIYLASMASYLTIPQVVAYTAAKSAVLGLVRATAAEVSEDGVRANGIAPGWITSPMTEAALGNDPARKAKIMSRTPMGRMGEDTDIGWAATYLASEAAGFVNGHVLAVDGGAVTGF
ncbi:MAG: glucose 1-dehydrogenase [Hyphomicrobiales bacterium]